jgi:GxxExxY protein
MLEQANSQHIGHTNHPEDGLTSKVISAAIEVHRALGPGLLESTYQACFVYELLELGMKIESQKPLPIIYKDAKLDCGYRLDLVIDEKIIVEVKAVDNIAPIHEAQILSYLRLSEYKIGLLINFNVKLLKQGIRRFID